MESACLCDSRPNFWPLTCASSEHLGHGDKRATFFIVFYGRFNFLEIAVAKIKAWLKMALNLFNFFSPSKKFNEAFDWYVPHPLISRTTSVH